MRINDYNTGRDMCQAGHQEPEAAAFVSKVAYNEHRSWGLFLKGTDAWVEFQAYRKIIVTVVCINLGSKKS